MKHKQKPWFIEVRGSYLPQAWQAWLLYIPYAAYLIGAPAYVLTHGYSIWQSILILVPNLVAAVVVMTWIAKATS